MHKIFEHVHYFFCKAAEWIVAGFSFVIFQIGIPIEVKLLVINPYLASFFHGLVSMLVPVGSYFIIHISKELLKDPESWLTIAFRKSVYLASFKWLKK
jgi:hypothetical protein